MKREPVIRWSPYSRKQLRRQRLQTTIIATLAYAVAVTGAVTCAYLVIMELHSSLQIIL